MGLKRNAEAENRHRELGRQLTQAREQVAHPGGGKIGHLTQAQVANKLGWSTSTVGKLEMGFGTPDPFRVRYLAKYYSKPLMPWLRLACGDELIDVILRADREEKSVKNQTSQGTMRAATKDIARPKAIKSKASVPAHEKSAGNSRAEGIRLFSLAGRPTKEQFVLVYGKRGPKMTWEQRAATGVPAEKFQRVLHEKLRSTSG